MPTAWDWLALWFSKTLMSIAGSQVRQICCSSCTLINLTFYSWSTERSWSAVPINLLATYSRHFCCQQRANKFLSSHFKSKTYLFLAASWQDLMHWPPESMLQRLPQKHGAARKLMSWLQWQTGYHTLWSCLCCLSALAYSQLQQFLLQPLLHIVPQKKHK